MIFESPDNGKTIYAREAGSNTRTLISEPLTTDLSIHELRDIINRSKDVPALQHALENVILIYKIIKDDYKNNS